MMISVNRNQQACCTCVFWGGDRRLIVDKFDKVKTEGEQTGLCNGPGVIKRHETNALETCSLWREI
jgi:hypothetical protein